MDQNEMLQAVLNDPQKLQSAIAMATSLLGGGTDAAKPNAANADANGSVRPLPAPAASAPPLPSLDPSAEWMLKILPLAQQVMESSQQVISPEKRALLGAMKPFVSEAAGRQIDHGIRLVMLAHVATAVLGQMGQLGRGSDTQGGGA